MLVLGVGGNVGQGILKALALSALPWRVVAACINSLSLGLYRADLALVSPRASDPEFLPWLERTCREERVDAVLSGAEPVLEALARAAPALHERTGALCLVSRPEVLEVGQDKLRTARWLEHHGLAHPRSASADDPGAVAALLAEVGLPLVVKPRRGKGAQDVAVVRSEHELEALAGRAGFLVQEWLPDGVEFTAGAMVDRDGRVRGTVVMRRELSGGTTVRGELGDFPEVRAHTEAIAAQLRPTGPLNAQLRLREGLPVAFELNVRFSGTTPARARAGYNEVEAALRHYLLGEELSLPEATRGTMLRYWNEMYVPDGAREALARDGRLDDPWAAPVVVEDWGMHE